MDVNDNTINLLCNSLNAQAGLSRHIYAKTGDKRELTLSIYMERAQIIIGALQNELESQK